MAPVSPNRSAVILGTSRGQRRLDTRDSVPSVLLRVGDDRTVLDWCLHGLRHHGVENITYIGGYHLEKVVGSHPSLSFRYDPEWATGGEIAAWMRYETGPADLVLVRDNTLALPEAFDRLLRFESEISIGRYEGTSGPCFAGVLSIPARQMAAVREHAGRILELNSEASIEDLVELLASGEMAVEEVDLSGFAASLPDAEAVAQTVFKGKARTLEQLAPLLGDTALVPALARFTVNDWLADRRGVIARISEQLPYEVVVRSSARGEDSLTSSDAGRFRSVLDVDGRDAEPLAESIDRVIASFEQPGRSASPDDEFLVQRQITDLQASGVLLTRDLVSGAPYLVLNIDRASGRSDTVTSGSHGEIETYFVYASTAAEATTGRPEIAAPIRLGNKLIELTRRDALDIEFGLDSDGTCHLFQVRPLAADAERSVADDDYDDVLERAHDFLAERMAPRPGLLGSTTILGTMPDWNPAEMIGVAPTSLALSLYQRLIGDRAWATARARIGYRDVRPAALILSLCGRPYVDVRASLNSFLPATVPASVGHKLVDAALDRLRERPELHDKLEFDVAVTCHGLDVGEVVDSGAAAGLTPNEAASFQESLLTLTDDVLGGSAPTIESQLRLVEELGARRAALIDHLVNAPTTERLTHAIERLADDCIRFGTEPFSILARYAFMAVALLKSLQKVGILGESDVETLMLGISTVAGEITRDAESMKAGELARDEFISRYGHLRPSSYDITSPNYAEALDRYFRLQQLPEPRRDLRSVASSTADLLTERGDQVDRALSAAGFSVHTEELGSFIIAAIAARERAKFELMKNVDRILELVADFGRRFELSRAETAHLPIERIIQFASNSSSGAMAATLRREASYREKAHTVAVGLRLPDLIVAPGDVYVHKLEAWTPNFVSSKKVTAEPAQVDGARGADDLGGKIVLIRAADPGYDWIFASPIAGLITQYGGAASHMAIRAAEFGLPAAIGCGEHLFQRMTQANEIELDCANRRVRRIR